VLSFVYGVGVGGEDGADVVDLRQRGGEFGNGGPAVHVQRYLDHGAVSPWPWSAGGWLAAAECLCGDVVDGESAAGGLGEHVAQDAPAVGVADLQARDS
jgi:hypothetical protein